MGEIVNFEPKPRRKRSRDGALEAQVLLFLGVRYVRGAEAEAALKKTAGDPAEAPRRQTPPGF